MNRMNSGSIISRPATLNARTTTTEKAKRCGRSQRKYSRRYSRRFGLPAGFFSSAGFGELPASASSSSFRCLYFSTNAR